MIRVLEARQLIARNCSGEAYEKLSEFVNDVHTMLMKADGVLSYPLATSDEERVAAYHKIRELLGLEPEED